MTTDHTTLLSEAPGPSSPAHEKPTVTGTGALARSGRRAAAALLVALAALLALPLQAQSAVLVSNLGQTNGSVGALGSFDQAQAFTTGDNNGGYTLTSVEIQTTATPNLDRLTVSIRSDSSGSPDASLGTLTNPASLPSDGLAAFTASGAGIDLEKETTYFVLVDVTGGAGGNIQNTASDNEDANPATNWSIGDTSLYRSHGSNGSWTSFADSKKIRINGTVGGTTLSTDATLSGLALADNSGTAITLSPSTFVSTTKSYTAAVANSIDEITITPTVNESNATYEIQNASGTALTDADTNTTGFQVDLTVGATTIKVEVTAEDTTTDTYQVTVTRATATPPPTHCETDDIWCATMTVAEVSAAGFTLGYGYNGDPNPSQGALSDDDFEYDGTEYTITRLYVTSGSNPLLRIKFNPTGEMVFNTDDFFLYVDGTAFSFSNATFASGDLFAWGDSGLSWSVSDTVEVRLVEQSGTAATGKPTISGTARVGQTLTADTSGIADADGLTSVSYSYQWIRVQNLLQTEISGATASTYTPVADDVGKTIRVKVTFSDDAGNPENSTSDAYPSGGTVEDIATGNATGQPVITGAAQVGKTLTAGLGNIADTDGLPGTFPDDYTLQWVRVDADGVSNEADLSGETSGTYTPVAADVGKKIKVAVSFTDDGSTAEGPLTSAAYPSNAPVAAAAGACPAVNDWCGKVTVALEGFSFGYEFDKFGLLDDNMIEYGGKEIEVWTVHVIPQLPRGLTYIYFGSIPRVPRGTVITLGELTYTTDVVSDDGSVGDRWDFPEDGFPPGLDWSVGQEVRVSLVLGSFPAEGAVAISGTAQVGSTLTADPSGITDTDGLTTPTYTYQWLRVDADGVSNETTIGANAATYTLVAADVGKKIKVQVSFTDDRGHIETVTSDATVVAAPPGVTVSKSTLTVTEQSTTGDSYTVVLDSEPTANVVVTVAGHSGTDVTPVPTTLTFTDSDWATAKTVTVTAADDADTVDDEVSLTHSAMSTDTDYSGITIAGVTVTVDDNDDANTPATGQPVITGAAQVGKTLTAGLGNIADTDGLPGTFPDDYTLQWVRVDADGVSNEADLSGETSGTYTPVAADVGKKIKVAVSFTDDGSTAEGPLTSAAYPSNAPVAAAAGACPPDNDWCTTLTVGFSEDGIFKYYGFSTAITDDGLADTTIDDGDGTTWTVSTMVIADAIINDQVHINLDAFLARGSVFDLGGTTFTTDETSESTVTTGNYSWLLPAGFAWVHGQDVTVSVKLPANAPATGVPEISGSPQVGKTLSAGTTGIMDLDGLTSVSYTYQWIRVDVDGTSNPVDVGTDDDEYTLVAADEGKRIKVQVTFTDDDSNAEELTSAAYLTPSHHSYPDRGIMPAQTACPASNTWCATMNVGFQLPGTDNTEFGFSASPGYGALDDTSFDYDGSTFTVENVGIRNPDGMSGYHVRLGLDAFVPRGAVFDLNGYTFTADAAAEQTSTGRYRWALPVGFRIAEGVDYRVSLQLTENTPRRGRADNQRHGAGG